MPGWPFSPQTQRPAPAVVLRSISICGALERAFHHLSADRVQPPTVRRFLFSGNQHFVGVGATPTFGTGNRMCQQLSNPTHYGASARALIVALSQWVTTGRLPPPSRVPSIADGTLVATDRASTGFPHIVVVAPGMTAEAAKKMLIRILTQLGKERVDGVAAPITASCGIVTSTEPTCDPEKLLAKADQVMYRAKEASKRPELRVSTIAVEDGPAEVIAR